MGCPGERLSEFSGVSAGDCEGFEVGIRRSQEFQGFFKDVFSCEA